jgi:outer membrane protein OmpA-like peptidoglycan-associated protein
VWGRSGIIGLQLHRENISIGVSYDFPVFIKNVANIGAFEIGLELRKLVTPKRKNKTANKKPPKDKQAPVEKVKSTSAQKELAKVHVTDSTVNVKLDSVRVMYRTQARQDSVAASGAAGKIQHQPLILEEATLKFGFMFNSTKLSPGTEQYMEDLAIVLLDNPTLKIRLVGHTDNVGSEKFNLMLSIQRAQKLKDFLLKKGVASDKVEVAGKGMSQPLNDNKTEQKRSANRRVELTILQD